MKYAITYSPEAQEGLAKLKRSEPASFKKAVKLLNEIADHPQTGTGHPEPLKGKPETSRAEATVPRLSLYFHHILHYPLEVHVESVNFRQSLTPIVNSFHDDALANAELNLLQIRSFPCSFPSRSSVNRCTLL